jgi:hypothetical protein
LSPAPDIVAPIARTHAPVVWRKNGPVDALRFWLRSAGRNMMAILTPSPQARHADPKLRTRKELLLEIAILRQENAEMRKELNRPALPFGRQVADSA